MLYRLEMLYLGGESPTQVIMMMSMMMSLSIMMTCCAGWRCCIWEETS